MMEAQEPSAASELLAELPVGAPASPLGDVAGEPLGDAPGELLRGDAPTEALEDAPGALPRGPFGEVPPEGASLENA